jgi:hypothetical protein
MNLGPEYMNASHLINLITWYLWWRQNVDFSFPGGATGRRTGSEGWRTPPGCPPPQQIQHTSPQAVPGI